MKKACRLLITTQCNLACPYCINKLPSVIDGFRPITRYDFLDISSRYESINISGGEPFLNFNFLEGLVNQCVWHNNSKAYIYTNGIKVLDALVRPSANTLSLDRMLKKISGLTIGLHPTQVDRDKYQQLNDLLKGRTSVRFIGIKEFLPDGEDYLVGANIRLVDFNQDCSNPDEDKFILV